MSNTKGLDLSLKNKSNSIVFHFVQEVTARDEWRTTYIKTNDNTSDMLTKHLPSERKKETGYKTVTSFVSYCAGSVAITAVTVVSQSQKVQQVYFVYVANYLRR